MTDKENSKKGRPEETRRKIAETLRGIKRSDEFREKTSRAMKGIPKGPVSEETRRRMSEAHRGKKHSEETRKKISESSRNRVVSEETRRKMSAAHQAGGRTYPQRGEHRGAKRIHQYTMDGELVRTWDCMRDISDDPAFPSPDAVRDCCKGIRESYKGFRWEYAKKREE